MAARRILASWIGHTDLLSMASDLSEQQQARVLKSLRFKGSLRVQNGPIQTLLKHEQFDEVHLLSNYSPYLNRLFKKWVNDKVVIHTVKLDDPTDYPAVFRAVDSELKAIVGNSSTELAIHLSPGTPAMAAVWVLLGKSRYRATFYQSHDGRAWQTDIPFDLVADFVPEVLRDPDFNLQHLAARNPSEVDGFEDIVGDSKILRLAVGRAQKAALRDVPVLILGESGTGKEMFARAIHKASRRKNEKFVPINCAAIPESLLESELFGHKKGAFSGATADREGAFEQANGGTIFLDEVGECSADMQAKLLRVLQPPPGKGPSCREFSRVGEAKTRTVDVRIIAATNRNLMDSVTDGDFREDLFYRLAVIKVKLPPLRDRKSDIPLLVKALMRDINADFKKQEEPGYHNKSVSEAAKIFVRGYDWPGNVRQLRNTLVEAAVMANSDSIGVGDIRAAIADVPGKKASNDLLEHPLGEGFSLQELLEDVQRHYLDRAMDEAHGVKRRAAKMLGYTNYQTLDAQLKRLKVNEKIEPRKK